MLEVLLANKHFTAEQCDLASRQFAAFCDDVVRNRSSEFLSFRETKTKVAEADRLDDFFTNLIGERPEYAELQAVIQLCLILSHGQATVESGFSINKDILIENQLEETLVAQRRVYDAIQCAGGIHDVQLSPSLLTSVRSARSRYQEYLDNKKAKKVEDDKANAKKRKLEELTTLKEKRRRLDTDRESMEKNADRLAEQAENSSNLTLLAKSNALRKAAKGKKKEIEKIDEQIATVGELA